jgi:CSLREA domain-containing protein
MLRQGRTNRRTGRATLEVIEARRLLSTIIVNTLADESVANSTTSLREAIAAAVAGDTVKFQAGMSGTITLSSGALVVGKNLTVVGPGAAAIKISGNDASRVLDIAAGVNVSLSGLTFIHGRAEMGGGIRNAGALSLTKCALTNNAAIGGNGQIVEPPGTAGGLNQPNGGPGVGGGIYNTGRLTADACTFTDNSAVGGDGTADTVFSPITTGSGGDGLGGAVYDGSDRQTRFTDCVFSANRASGGTGSYAAGGRAAGGAVFDDNGGELKLEHCTLRANAALGGGTDTGDLEGTPGGLAEGGAVATDTAHINIYYGTFSGNIAAGGQGATAIDIGGNGGNAAGGAIYARKSLTTLYGTFSGNGATGGNGGHALKADIFGYGSAGSASGGAIEAYGVTDIRCVTFVTNDAAGGVGGEGGDAAGAAFAGHDQSIFYNCAFRSNEARGGIADFGGASRGAGIFQRDGELTVLDSSFESNVAAAAADHGWGAEGASAEGGAIFAGKISLDGSTLSGNRAVAADGGAAMAWRDITWSAGDGGAARGGGLAIDLGGAAAVTRSTFYSNWATAGRGGDGLDPGNLHAGDGGIASGGAASTLGDLAMTAVTIAGNHAVGGTKGGGVNAGAANGAALGGGVNRQSPDFGSLVFADTLLATNIATAEADAASAPDVEGAVASLGFNLIGKTDGSTGWVVTDKRGSLANPLDPKLGPLRVNGGTTATMALLSGSPALDAGKAFGLTFDQRLAKRPLNLSSVPNAPGSDGSDIGAFELQSLVAPVQTPFKNFDIGTNPVTVQLEDFDNGGDGVAWHDTDTEHRGGAYRDTAVDIQLTTDAGGGYNVGWTKAGEWLEYTADVAKAGTYTVDFRLASNGVGGKFHLEVDGKDVTGQLAVPNTGGWQTWKSVTKTGVSLPAGKHVLRLVMDNVGATGSVGNFNYMRFTAAAAAPVTVNTSTAAYVRDGSYRGVNYGAAATLDVKKSTIGYNREAYLKFDLGGVAGIGTAKLRLHGALADAGAPSIQLGVFPASATSWTESGLTWTSKPTTGSTPLAVTTVSGTAKKWYEIDLSSFLKAEKAAGRNVVTLVVKSLTTANTVCSFNSDEVGSGPQVVVQP